MRLKMKMDLDLTIALLKRLVEIESPSHEKAAVDQVGALLADHCSRLGGQVKFHAATDAGDTLEVSFSPALGGDKGMILLLAHMDTVHPIGTIKSMPFTHTGDRITGPGVLDMKGGIAVALSALEGLMAEGLLSHPVKILFTSDEETGSRTSRGLIESLAACSQLVLVLEPGMSDGAVKTWRKGVGEYSIRAFGRAAHAGADHQLGRNAIQEVSHQVIAIQALTDYAKDTTLNVGLIHGGTASNVVPQEARVEVDLRVMQPGEADRIHAALQGLKPVIDGTRLEITGGLNRPPMPFDSLMQATFNQAKTIAAGIGMTLTAGGTGGASDANFVAPLGIPVLDGLGPIGDEAHSEREFILTHSLVERARLLAALIREW
jgi:glutamate carboxypeptidase